MRDDPRSGSFKNSRRNLLVRVQQAPIKENDRCTVWMHDMRMNRSMLPV